MKLREFILCSILGVFGTNLVILVLLTALWIYDQPAGVRNTITAIIASITAISAAALFGAEYIKKRRSRK